MRVPISALAATVLVFASAAEVAAQRKQVLVLFKDGYSIRGVVKRDTELLFDPASKSSIPIAKTGGFFQLDNGARLIIFSPSQAAEVFDEEADTNLIRFSQLIPRTSRPELPGSWSVLRAAEWDERLERLVSLDTSA